MLIASWLRRSEKASSPACLERKRPRTKRSRLLSPRPFDVLEGRTLLSTFTVNDLADSGPGSLRAAVAAADVTAGADLITFAPKLHGTITLTSGPLDLSAVPASLTIEGPAENELTLSGNNASRVFDISTGATVAIDNLTITDGKVVADNGGGILVQTGATLALEQVVVTGNSAYADARGNFGSGGGIENDGSLTVTQSIFTSNLASGGSFTDPITEGSAGGAIDSQGPSLTVTGSAFSSNHAVGPTTGTGEGNGGAINTSSTATITGSSFSGNLAFGRTSNGGAISAGENELIAVPSMAINTCTFTGNVARGADGANDFTEKFGGQALGGAIASAAPLTIAGSAFTNNVAQAGNQGDNLDPIDGGPFADSAYGGGVANIAAPLVVTNTAFIDNQAIGGSSAAGIGGTAVGGGVEADIFASTTFTGVTLVGNQAIGGSGGPGYTGGTAFGGGFYSGVDSSATVSGSLFSGNLAQGGAGGSGAAGAAAGGGAIANGGGFGDLEVAFLGLGTDSSTLSLTGSTVALNVARGGAGGPGGGDGGSGAGGGFYADPGTTTTISASILYLNAAIGGAGSSAGIGIGGGIDVASGASVSLETTTARVNDASTNYDNIDGSVTNLS
jgi:hypothetical protein